MANKTTGVHTIGALAQLENWSLTKDGTAIERQFQFDNFVSAFGFMTQIALKAEKLNHHPDWSNSYNKVAIRLTTHSAGGLSELDIKLAHAIDAVYASALATSQFSQAPNRC